MKNQKLISRNIIRKFKSGAEMRAEFERDKELVENG